MVWGYGVEYCSLALSYMAIRSIEVQDDDVIITFLPAFSMTNGYMYALIFIQ